MSATAQSDGLLDRVPVVQGAIVGVGAFVAGYLLTFVLAAIDSDLGDTESSSFDATGWLYYGAHFADIELDTPIGSETMNFLSEASTQFPTVVYYLVPVVVLVASGFVLAKLFASGDEVADSAIAGAGVVAGYLPLALVGTFLFSESEEFGSVSPDLVTGVLLVGLVFPIVLGAVGGIVAAKTE